MEKAIIFPIWLITMGFRFILRVFWRDPIFYLPDSIARVFLWWDLKESVWSCKGDDCEVDMIMPEIENVLYQINKGVLLKDIRPLEAK